MTKLCKCGCKTEIADNRTWAKGHNRRGVKHTEASIKKMRDSTLGYKHTPETIEKIRVTSSGRKHTPETIEKLRIINLGNTYGSGNLGRKYAPETIEKNRIAHLGKTHTPETTKKMRLSQLKRYAEMENPGLEICNHHYIYDFNDLTKYTILVTRSEHTIIHNNLRAAGLEVPHINILKED